MYQVSLNFLLVLFDLFADWLRFSASHRPFSRLLRRTL